MTETWTLKVYKVLGSHFWSVYIGVCNSSGHNPYYLDMSMHSHKHLHMSTQWWLIYPVKVSTFEQNFFPPTFHHFIMKVNTIVGFKAQVRKNMWRCLLPLFEKLCNIANNIRQTIFLCGILCNMQNILLKVVQNCNVNLLHVFCLEWKPRTLVFPVIFKAEEKMLDTNHDDSKRHCALL